mgnify:CR=1 FL=1
MQYIQVFKVSVLVHNIVIYMALNVLLVRTNIIHLIHILYVVHIKLHNCGEYIDMTTSLKLMFENIFDITVSVPRQLLQCMLFSRLYEQKYTFVLNF